MSLFNKRVTAAGDDDYLCFYNYPRPHSRRRG